MNNKFKNYKGVIHDIIVMISNRAFSEYFIGIMIKYII